VDAEDCGKELVFQVQSEFLSFKPFFSFFLEMCLFESTHFTTKKSKEIVEVCIFIQDFQLVKISFPFFRNILQRN